MEHQGPRYLVFGAGALGSVFGGFLQMAGRDVTYIGRGRPTEIDALNGAISRYARDLGIETPYNDSLTRLIKLKESESSKRLRENR